LGHPSRATVSPTKVVPLEVLKLFMVMTAVTVKLWFTGAAGAQLAFPA
jgi:hypothetical protein